MLQLVVSQSESEIEAHKEDLEYMKIMSLRWPLNCRWCGRRGDLNLQEFQEHEDECH